MNMKVALIAIIGSSLLLLVILELVRRKYLKERYALLWIATGSLFLLLSIWTDILFWISNFLGFTVPSNALFFFGLLFFLVIILSLSVITSRLSEKNKILAQKVVLLEKRVADLEQPGKADNPEEGKRD